MTNEEMFELLDVNNSEEKQKKGLDYARTIKQLDVFLQPSFADDKMVWNNCALILSEKSDEELEPYLVELLEWLQDMNWPGADVIMNRLMKYEKSPIFMMSLSYCINCIEKINDDVWRENVKDLVNNTFAVI